jgi:hypothetical protein
MVSLKKLISPRPRKVNKNKSGVRFSKAKHIEINNKAALQ